MVRILDKVSNGYILYILRDLNGWIGDGARASITDAFGIPGENDNGRKVMELCGESGLCLGITYFEHRSLHKYTRVSRGQDRVEVKSMINLVLVKRICCFLCAGCEGSERNGTRPLKSPYCTV